MRSGRMSEGNPCKVDGCPFRELADGLCVEHIRAAALAPKPVEDPQPPAPAARATPKTPKE